MININVKPLPHFYDENGGVDIPLPERASKGASGYDLYSATEIKLYPFMATKKRSTDRHFVLISTGLCFEIPEGYEMVIRPRSGLANKHSIIIPNSPGTIDSDYRGEVKVGLLNLGNMPYQVMRGDRIAQAVIQRKIDAKFVCAPKLSDTDRGSGGFGPTGR